MKDVYSTVSMYLDDFPEAEKYREWLTRKDVQWAMVRITDADHWGHFPGGYLRLGVFPLRSEASAEERAQGGGAPRKGRVYLTRGWRVYLADNDDTENFRDFPPDAESSARSFMDGIKAAAPFSMTQIRSTLFTGPDTAPVKRGRPPKSKPT
jgi:hypothetical protein